MDSCGLSKEVLFQFCDAHTVRLLRRTCRTYQQQIPLGWTKDNLFVTDHPFTNSKKGITSEAFLEYQHSCRFARQLVLANVRLSGTVCISPSMRLLDDFTLVHSSRMHRLQFHPHHTKLRTIMIYDSPALTEVVLPEECTSLDELTLTTLSLERWTFHPSWSALRVISFTNVGKFPLISLPSTYTNLEQVHITDVGLEQLELHMDLTTREELFERLTLRIHERRSVELVDRNTFKVRIVTASKNRPWLHILSNCATAWVLQ